MRCCMFPITARRPTRLRRMERFLLLQFFDPTGGDRIPEGRQLTGVTGRAVCREGRPHFLPNSTSAQWLSAATEGGQLQ
jgi:hypothetical protein